MSSTLESYELIRFAEAFEGRIATAGEMLAGRPGLEAEKSWLTTALELVRTTRAPASGVVDRVKDLPELDEAREEYSFHQQGLWVDALEKLHAGITFTASSRAPVIEALFPHLKFAQLRRAPREVIFEYATSYERRTRSSYVSRIFAREDFALVRPVVDQVAAAHAEWRASHEPAPLSLEQEAMLREELVNLGRKLEVALRQARLLSEAALVPVPSVHEAAALGLKPKRRAGRGLAPSDDGLGAFDLEPSDSMEPTEAELAEVAALDSSSDGEVPLSPSHASTEGAVVAADAVDTHVEQDTGPAATGPHESSADTAVSEALATSEPERGNAAEETRAVAPRGRKRESEEAPSSGDGTTDSAETSRPGSGRGRKRASEAGSTSGEASGDSEGARGRRARDPGSPPTASDTANASEGSHAQSARGRAREPGSPPTASDTANASEGSRAPSARGRARDSSASLASDDSAAPEPSRAQAPAVRKKKGVTSTPGAAGTETP
ncbi:hypothetical protein ACN469_19555 [Corallococcus terminator]